MINNRTFMRFSHIYVYVYEKKNDTFAVPSFSNFDEIMMSRLNYFFFLAFISSRYFSSSTEFAKTKCPGTISVSFGASLL